MAEAMGPNPHDLNRQRNWVCALQIAERRRRLGLTQRDVVDRLAVLGISATNRTLSAMEHGQGMEVGRLPELAIALECTVTYLLGMTSEPHNWEPDPGAVPAPQPGLVVAVAADHECWLHYPGAVRGSDGGGPDAVRAADGARSSTVRIDTNGSDPAPGLANGRRAAAAPSRA
jgi:hypothetical protein